MARYPEDADPTGAAGPVAGWWSDLRSALALLTRLPVRAPAGIAAWPRACRTFSLVGIVVGLAGAAALAIAVHLDLSRPIAAIIALAVTVLITGALHEDGLADTADGFGGGSDRESKLAIMRDSRIGTYGVLTLLLTTLARMAALASLGLGMAAAALVAAHALSRAGLPLIMQREVPARTDGLAISVGQPAGADVAWALGIGALAALIALGIGTAVVAIIVAALSAFIVVALARRQIGGYTGDTLGAAQQAMELAVLLTVVALH